MFLYVIQRGSGAHLSNAYGDLSPEINFRGEKMTTFLRAVPM
jgi:hypothetical protein